MIPRIATLVFKPHSNHLLRIERAEICLRNGIKLSVIQGPDSMALWEPGLYEAAILDPADDWHIERGTAADIEAWLTRLAALPAATG